MLYIDKDMLREFMGKIEKLPPNLNDVKDACLNMLKVVDGLKKGNVEKSLLIRDNNCSHGNVTKALRNIIDSLRKEIKELKAKEATNEKYY